MNQGFDRVEGVETLIPEMFVIPCIFADGEGHLLTTKRKQHLTPGGCKIAHLVEDVIGGQQHFGLQECHSAIFEQGGGVHH